MPQCIPQCIAKCNVTTTTTTITHPLDQRYIPSCLAATLTWGKVKQKEASPTEFYFSRSYFSSSFLKMFRIECF